MCRDDILERVIKLFSTMTDAEVSEDSEIMEDLDITSMDVLFLISSIEEEFKIKVAEKAIRNLETVGDVADVVVDCL